MGGLLKPTGTSGAQDTGLEMKNLLKPPGHLADLNSSADDNTVEENATLASNQLNLFMNLKPVVSVPPPSPQERRTEEKKEADIENINL